MFRCLLLLLAVIVCLTHEKSFITCYIPLTNLVFSVRTVSYGPSFFPLIYGPSAKPAGHKSTVKSEVNRRAGKETSQSEAEGSTKNAVPKSQKLNLLGC